MIARTLQRFARADAGFSLMEALVAMLCGVVVTGALFGILEVSLRQTSRLTDKTQATQLGRAAMTNMIDELHSACMSREFAPVQAESSEKELRVQTGFSQESVIGYKDAYEHRIAWEGTYPNGGKLIDKTYNALSTSSWPAFKFEKTATPASGVVLATNVYQQSKTVPIFQYYKYATKTSPGGTEAPTSTLELTTPPKDASSAKGIAAVQIGFKQAPTNNNITLGRPAEFNTLVTFAFASPASEATIVDGPCQ